MKQTFWSEHKFRRELFIVRPNIADLFSATREPEFMNRVAKRMQFLMQMDAFFMSQSSETESKQMHIHDLKHSINFVLK